MGVAVWEESAGRGESFSPDCELFACGVCFGSRSPPSFEVHLLYREVVGSEGVEFGGNGARRLKGGCRVD